MKILITTIESHASDTNSTIMFERKVIKGHPRPRKALPISFINKWKIQH